MKPRHHVIISGTGRAGTSFLVKLLTALGLDTGFDRKSSEENWVEYSRAGLESNIRDENAPYIVKTIFFCNYVDEITGREDIVLDHVFIPVREMDQAVASRVHVSESQRAKLPWLKRLLKGHRSFAGGLMGTGNPARQKAVLQENLSNLLVGLSKTHIPVTLLNYPRLTEDPDYLFDKLKPVLGEISREEFQKAFQDTVRPDWVHKFK